MENMAESNDESSNWWGSWITSAKTKSASVFEAVKKDLDEISTAVRTEVSNAGAVIGETLKLDEPESTANTVKKSLSSFFGQVSEALVPTIDDDDVEAVLITNDGTITLTGFQKHLADIQANNATYLNPPDEILTENYKRWLEVIEQDQFTQTRLAKHLSSSEILNEKYLSLVPEQIPHMEFWKRYLFKRAMLEDALANAEIAERRARSELNSTKPVSPRKTIIQTKQPKKVLDENDMNENSTESISGIDEDELKWKSENLGNVDISEEEQDRLLQEYDQEMKDLKKKKSLIIPLEEKLKLEAAERNEKSKKNGTAQKKTPPKTTAQTKKDQPKTQTDHTNKQPISSDKKNSKAKTPQAKSNSSNTTADKLAIEKDHFNNKDVKDDTSSNSDESWEKDFDLTEK